jgi:hypothetical protein
LVIRVIFNASGSYAAPFMNGRAANGLDITTHKNEDKTRGVSPVAAGWNGRQQAREQPFLKFRCVNCRSAI